VTFSRHAGIARWTVLFCLSMAFAPGCWRSNSGPAIRSGEAFVSGNSAYDSFFERVRDSLVGDDATDRSGAVKALSLELGLDATASENAVFDRVRQTLKERPKGTANLVVEASKEGFRVVPKGPGKSIPKLMTLANMLESAAREEAARAKRFDGMVSTSEKLLSEGKALLGRVDTDFAGDSARKREQLRSELAACIDVLSERRTAWGAQVHRSQSFLYAMQTSLSVGKDGRGSVQASRNKGGNGSKSGGVAPGTFEGPPSSAAPAAPSASPGDEAGPKPPEEVFEP
jgi:hypothetical protein